MKIFEIINNSLKEIANKHNVTISQIATAYVINKGTLPIIGATKVKHVKEAYEASKIILNDDEIKYLEQ